MIARVLSMQPTLLIVTRSLAQRTQVTCKHVSSQNGQGWLVKYLMGFCSICSLQLKGICHVESSTSWYLMQNEVYAFDCNVCSSVLAIVAQLIVSLPHCFVGSRTRIYCIVRMAFVTSGSDAHEHIMQPVLADSSLSLLLLTVLEHLLIPCVQVECRGTAHTWLSYS